MPEYPDTMFVSHTIAQLHTEGTLESWPLHMTVVPPFTFEEVTNPIPTVERVIKQTGRSIGPIRLEFGEIRPGAIPVEIGDLAYYGTDEQVEARAIPVAEIIDLTGKLHELHNQLLHNLGAIGCRFLDLRWSLDKYSPHVNLNNGVLNRPFFCTSLTLNMWRNDVRRVVSDLSLCD